MEAVVQEQAVEAVARRRPARVSLEAFTFMSPTMLLVTLFFFVPVLLLLWISLTNLSSNTFGNPLCVGGAREVCEALGIRAGGVEFVGLSNYRRLFADRFFPKILRNTLFYVFSTLALFNVGLALVLALLTTHIERRVGFLFRAIWLLPRITPSVIYIMMWKRIAADAPFGILNQFLMPVGVEPRFWLKEAPWLFVIVTNGFVGASFGMLIFSSAIESIPRDYIMAAKVDGATTLQIIRTIIIPLIKWPLLFVTTYQTLSLLASFEYILLLTNGGPGLYRTEVWSLTAYHRALQTYFGNNQWGYGAAWGFVLVVIGIIFSVIYLRVFRFNELVQEPKIDAL